MIVSAGITEHIEGLSQLIRWQDVTTSTLKNSQKTVKKSQKGTIKGDQTCTRTLLFLQESLSTLSRGLFQLIRWQDVFKLVYDRTYQIKVFQNRTWPDQTRQDQTGPDRTGPEVSDRWWIKRERGHCCFCKIHGAHWGPFPADPVARLHHIVRKCKDFEEDSHKVPCYREGPREAIAHADGTAGRPRHHLSFCS